MTPSTTSPPRPQSGSRLRSFTYDSLSRRISVTNPESGTVTYTFDADGNTVTETKPSPSQIGGASGTGGTGTASVAGSEQSIPTNGPSGTGTVTISGSEQQKLLTFDSGTVSITVNGFTASYNYGRGATAQTIASHLASSLNAGSSPVTASASGAVITLTAKTTGTASNYSLSTSVTWNQSTFTNPSFTATPSGSTLTGGAPGPPTYDTGTVLITVNGFQASANYGQGSTAASVAGAIADAFNTNSSPVFAFASGTAITLTARTVGSSTDYSVSCGSATNLPSTFAQPSFNASCPTVLTGGTNPGSMPTVTLSYCYDPLNRMTSKAYTLNPVRCLHRSPPMRYDQSLRVSA